jgi:thiamine pyrophosphokinase
VELSTVLLPPEKDFSDFGAALDILENKVLAARGIGAGHVVHLRVERGLGGRRDHEMCNILEAAEFLDRLSRRGITGAVDFDAQVVCFSGKLTWQSTQGAPFSLCCLRGTGAVEISGARYGGTTTLSRGSHGLSNVVEQGEVVVKASEGGVFLLMSGEASRELPSST